jgi:hypothetical protein
MELIETEQLPKVGNFVQWITTQRIDKGIESNSALLPVFTACIVRVNFCHSSQKFYIMNYHFSFPISSLDKSLRGISTTVKLEVLIYILYKLNVIASP